MAHQLGKNYKQTFAEWRAKEEANGLVSVEQYKGAELFAHYLDSFQNLSTELQIIAMIQARKVDREVLEALIAEIGADKAAPIMKGIFAKYKVTGQ